MVSIDLSTVESDGHSVVGLRGELDAADAAGVAVSLAGVVSRHPDIIIDLTDLAFIDCGGLWALAATREQAAQAGGGLLLAGPQQPVLRILALTGLAEVFSVHPTVEQARAGAPVTDRPA